MATQHFCRFLKNRKRKDTLQADFGSVNQFGTGLRNYRSKSNFSQKYRKHARNTRNKVSAHRKNYNYKYNFGSPLIALELLSALNNSNTYNVMSHSYVTPTRPPNWFETLGVSPDASVSSIRSAYRTMAKSTHPDIGARGSAEKFQQVHEAYKEGIAGRPVE